MRLQIPGMVGGMRLVESRPCMQINAKERRGCKRPIVTDKLLVAVDGPSVRLCMAVRLEPVIGEGRFVAGNACSRHRRAANGRFSAVLKGCILDSQPA